MQVTQSLILGQIKGTNFATQIANTAKISTIDRNLYVSFVLAAFASSSL